MPETAESDLQGIETPTTEFTPIEGGAIAGLIDQIVIESQPETQTFDVLIAIGGEIVKIPFRRLADGNALQELQEDAAKWAQMMMPRRVMKNVKLVPMSEEMKKWFVPKADVLGKVYLITKLALHPEFQSEAAVMKLFRQAWPVFQSILTQIDLALTNQSRSSEKIDFEDEKKDSNQITATG